MSRSTISTFKLFEMFPRPASPYLDQHYRAIDIILS